MNWLKKIKSKLFSNKKRDNHKSFDEIYSDLGVFQYNEDGFSLNYNEKNIYVKWSEIIQINVFKTDLITTDCLNMQFILKEISITVNEEFPGWYQCVIKVKEAFPTIPKDWDIEIIQPPFAKKFRTIYQRV